jgi:16S rRNA (guanine527-N7)-methyltransferase
VKGKLAQGLEAMRISLPDAALEKLLAYLDLLDKWNRSYKLTAVRGEKALAYHLLDSLAILPYIGAISGKRALDLGSGGGAPGIPLAIALPERELTLVESVSKKAAFLKQATIEIGLTNISVHCGRVEQYHPPFGFPAIVSRAFSSLHEFVACSRHLLAEEGRWLAMKGHWPKEEAEALPGEIVLEAVHPLCVPGVEGERHLAVLKQKGNMKN